MTTESRPTWQTELLWRESWSQAQFLMLLCGLAPDAPARADETRLAAVERERIGEQTLAAVTLVNDSGRDAGRHGYPES